MTAPPGRPGSRRRGAPYAAALSAAGTLAAIITFSLAGLWLGLHAAGFDATRALVSLWAGSFGSWFAFTSSTLVRASPLILTGLAVAVAFRAGAWNIGADGQLLVGAAAATGVALTWHAAASIVVIPTALAAGVLAGALWAGIAAILRTRFGVLEVISTIMLNFIALDLVGYLVRGPLQEPTHAYPQSDSIPNAARLPTLLPGSRLHIGLLLAVVAAPLTWALLRTTAAGFRLRLVGENPDAAHVAGRVDVDRTATRALLLSGALAGLAGAIELTGVTYALYENISPGYGYTAIAVALLAGLDPLAIVASAILFGGLEAGALSMQRDANVPAVAVSIVEASLVLLVLAVAHFRRGLWKGLARFAGESVHAEGSS